MGIYMPPLDEVNNTTREMIGEFRGYNHNLRIRDNELYDMQNMCSDLYPVLSPRKKRGKVRQLTKPNGLFAHEKLCWVDGTSFYYNGVLKGTVADSPKQFVSMGAYVLIWPDKKYYNTETEEFGSLGQSNTTSGTVTATLCKLDGTSYTGYTVNSSAPPEPIDGDLWLDTSDIPHVLRQYSEASGMWVSIPTTYVKIAATGVGTGFSELDGVTISGITNTALNGKFLLYGVDSNYIIVVAIIDSTVSQSEPVTVTREIPDMDYITESENRVWGCSSDKHEIYACKLGDAKNWNTFLGISTDSYVMTVGSSGDFTGCCRHFGYVLFFKEDVIHKIFGNKPANFQITNTDVRGVEKGNEKSLVRVNETLFYKARHDVCTLGASIPDGISDAFGQERYKDAVAGASGSKYYISVKKVDNTPLMLVFDSERGLWHKEDAVYASYFAAISSELYFINGVDNCIYSVNGNITDYADVNAVIENNITWSADSGDIGLNLPDSKYIGKLQIRLELGENSKFRIYLQYDNSGTWEEKFSNDSTRKRSYTVPIIPRRCDTMRIRFSGTGDCHVYSITKTIEQGSDV